MAQAKINGSTDWPMASNKPNFTSDENGGIPATLVIHEGKHEEVFTSSEVKEILRDAVWGRMNRPKQEHLNRFLVHSGGL